MPNILQLQKELESIPDDRLIQEVNAPNLYPAYLSTQELQRRQQLRESYQARMQQMPQGTVKDQLISRALSGIGSIPQQQQTQPMPAAMAMAQQGPPMMQGGMPPQGGMPMQMPMGAMAEGGIVGYSDGGRIPGYQDGGQPQAFADSVAIEPDDELSFVELGDDVVEFVKENPVLSGLIGTGSAVAARKTGPLVRVGGKLLPLATTGVRNLLGAAPRHVQRYGDAIDDVLKRARTQGPLREGVTRVPRRGRLGGLGSLLTSASRSLFAPLLGVGAYQLFTGDDEEADDGILLDIGGYGDYGNLGSADSSGSIGLGGDVMERLMNMIDQQGQALPKETALIEMMRQREDLLTQNRDRLTALDQRRIDFEEEQGRQMQELIDARRSRIEGRIDPEQDERDRLAALAGIVGGAISRGRFQEGGIGGGIAAGVPSLLDLRSQQRDRAERIEDSLDDLTLGGLQQVRDTRTAIDGIRREMLTGNISDEEARFQTRLEIANLEAEIERRGINPELLLGILNLQAQVQSAQLNAGVRDRLAVANRMTLNEALENILETSPRDDRTPQEIFDKAASFIDSMTGTTEGVTNQVNLQMKQQVINYLREKFPNIEFATGQDEEAGYSDGGMVGTGFDKLIPQP